LCFILFSFQFDCQNQNKVQRVTMFLPVTCFVYIILSVYSSKQPKENGLEQNKNLNIDIEKFILNTLTLLKTKKDADEKTPYVLHFLPRHDNPPIHINHASRLNKRTGTITCTADGYATVRITISIDIIVYGVGQPTVFWN